MKIRGGFVSNSSSSSFVCDITGQTESGYDASARDCGMVQCENGHTFLEQFEIEITDFDFEKYAREFVEAYNRPTWRKTELIDDVVIAFLTDRNGGPVEDYDTFIELVNKHYDEEYGSYNVPACKCPICTMQEVSTDKLLAYLIREKGKTRKELTAEIRNRFEGDNKAFEQHATRKL